MDASPAKEGQSMDRDRLVASLKSHEGYSRNPYRDHLGHWTVGTGHLLRDSLLSCVFRTVGDLLDHITDKAQHDCWLSEDIDAAIRRAEAWLRPVWGDLSDEQREVVAEMAFQLGNRIQGFTRARQAIVSGDYVKAADEFLDSLWARQTPIRAKTLVSKWLGS